MWLRSSLILGIVGAIGLTVLGCYEIVISGRSSENSLNSRESKILTFNTASAAWVKLHRSQFRNLTIRAELTSIDGPLSQFFLEANTNGDVIFDDDPIIDSTYPRLRYELNDIELHRPLTTSEIEKMATESTEFKVSLRLLLINSFGTNFALALPNPVSLASVEKTKGMGLKQCITGSYSQQKDECTVFRRLSRLCIKLSCSNCAEQGESWQLADSNGGIGCQPTSGSSVGELDIVAPQDPQEGGIPLSVEFTHSRIRVRSVFDPILVAAILTDNTRVFGETRSDAVIIGIVCLAGGLFGLAILIAKWFSHPHTSMVSPTTREVFATTSSLADVQPAMQLQGSFSGHVSEEEADLLRPHRHPLS